MPNFGLTTKPPHSWRRLAGGPGRAPKAAEDFVILRDMPRTVVCRAIPHADRIPSDQRKIKSCTPSIALGGRGPYLASPTPRPVPNAGPHAMNVRAMFLLAAKPSRL